MKRPHLVHFLSVKTKEHFSIRASVAYKSFNFTQGKEIEIINPKNPIENIRLLKSNEFKLKIIGINKSREEVYTKELESNGFGNFYYKFPLNDETEEIDAFEVFETRSIEGVELNLGTYFPLSLLNGNRIIICDFDKTLVETRYSTTKDVFNSLTRPLAYFPTLNNSLDILKSYLNENFNPFILSASPHFYEEAIRDWLYQNSIYTAGIFLKDFRQFFSISEGHLTTKDLKVQGLYKLNHLLDILLMTGIPEELILMGDNYESDPIIYLTLAILLTDNIDPWSLWNMVKGLESFKLNDKQNGQFLNKIYQLDSILNKSKINPKIKIYIRKKANEKEINVSSYFDKVKHLIHLYNGNDKDKVNASSIVGQRE